jgi:hypothetical protein
MEPITFTAIVAALSAGIATGVGKVGESALVDAYQGLKTALKRKFGDQSEVVEAVDMLEKRPDSEGRQVTRKEEVERANVDEDPDVKQAAKELLDRLKAEPGGEQHIQSAMGSYIAQADHSSTAEVRVNQPKEE